MAEEINISYRNICADIIAFPRTLALPVFCNLSISRAAKSRANITVFVCIGYEEDKKDLDV
jgi:hypothetical protein